MLETLTQNYLRMLWILENFLGIKDCKDVSIEQPCSKTLVGRRIEVNFNRHHGAANFLFCAGNIGALNYGEAQSAESTNDFVHKLKIVLKELRETLVCLKIIKRKPLITPASRLNSIIEENNELISIFVKSVETAKRNSKKSSV